MGASGLKAGAAAEAGAGFALQTALDAGQACQSVAVAGSAGEDAGALQDGKAGARASDLDFRLLHAFFLSGIGAGFGRCSASTARLAVTSCGAI